jgi:hypothetical protein
MQWISAHSDVLQIILNALTALVWIVYLQIFLVSFWRQRRPNLIINAGAGRGLEARCFVANLGLEPLYLSDVLVEIEVPGDSHRAIITDRSEMDDEQLNNPDEATNQGPISSGAQVDIGSFRDLAHRARELDGYAGEEIHAVEVITVAMTASKGSHIYTSRKWRVSSEEGSKILQPMSRRSKQITSWRERRKLKKELDQNLAD